MTKLDFLIQDLEYVLEAIESGMRPKGGASENSGKIPSLGGENIIQSGGVHLRNLKMIPTAFFESMSKGILKDGDVLINKDGANTGKVGWFKGFNLEKASINEHLFLLRGKEGTLDNGFLFYFLLSEFGQSQIKNKISGSAQPGLNTTFIKNFKITLPESVKEQSLIATILSKVDEAIAITEQLIAKYQHIKTGLMQDLLTKGIDEHGNIRSEETHAFKDSPFGRIPAEWEVTPINELCDLIVDCKNRTSPFVEKSNYPVIRTSNIRNGNLVWDDMKFTDSVSYKIWTSRAIPLMDDVIITREAPLGQVVKIPSGLTPVLGQRTMLFRVNKAKLLPDFLVFSIINERMQNYLSSMGGGSTVHHLKVEEMKNILISHPKSIDEQVEIEKHINNQEKNIRDLELQLSKLQSLKTGLMQDLLSGKVRVTELLTKEYETQIAE